MELMELMDPKDFLIKDGILEKYNGSDSHIVIPDGVTKIKQDAFFINFINADIVIPDTVTEIEDKAFMNSSALSGTLVIPSGVGRIGEMTFFNCRYLGEIVLPDGLLSIGDKAFADCNRLTSFTVPKSVTHIESTAFVGCGGLTEFKVEEGNTAFKTVDGVLFSADGKRLICYPTGRTAECYTVPEGVTEICKLAFSECLHITSVTIPDGVTRIGDGAFSQCRHLENTDLPPNITVLGSETFKATAIRETVIPEGVTEIGDSAFEECKLLKRVTVPASVRRIGNKAFPDCNAPTQIILSPLNPFFKIEEGVLYSADGKRLITAVSRMDLTDFTIPRGVTEIDSHAFFFAVTLKHIDIPEETDTIGDHAFCCSGLAQIKFPDKMEKIGLCAFGNCDALTEVTLPRVLHTLESYVFLSCATLSRVTLPESVVNVGPDVFEWSERLEEIRADLRMIRLFSEETCSFKTAVVRTGADRYGKEDLPSAEAECLKEYISKWLDEILPTLEDRPSFWRFITETATVDKEFALEQLKKSTLSPECRAILLDYVNPHTAKNGGSIYTL